VTNQASTSATNLWLFRYVVLLTSCTALLLLSGAYITGSAEQLTSTDQSIFAGSGQIHLVQAIVTLRNHTLLAIAVGALTVGLVAWVIVARNSNSVRLLSASALVILALDALVAHRAGPSLTPMIGIVHALCAHLFFSAIVVIATLTSPGWNRAPEVVDGRGHASLRGMALAAPVVVLAQIALGESYRHNVLGVLPHICGAFVATSVILLVSLTLTQDFADNRALNSTSIALLCIVLTQICVGIATFTMKLQHLDDTVAFLFSSTLHMLVGSLTLAASVVMAMQVLRNVRPSSMKTNSTVSL